MKLFLLAFFLIPIGCIQTSSFDRGRLASRVESVHKIPFSFDSELIIIEASVNGVQGRFLFDNGFSLSALNEDFARRANISLEGSSSIRDGNNKRTTLKQGTIQSLVIGEAEFIDTGSYIIDTNRFLPCDPIDGVIGASIINKINWKIDFQEKELSLSSNAFESSKEGVIVDYSISYNNSSLADFSLNDVHLSAKIDLGYQGDLKIDRDKFGYLFGGKLGRKNIGISSLSATGLGDIDTTYIIHAERATHDEQQLPVLTDVSLAGNLKYDAVMGVGYLKNYEVIINSSDQSYTLTPVPTELNVSIPLSYGISIYPVKDSFLIIQKDGHDPLLNSLPLMSKLTSIDGQDAGSITGICELKEILRAKAASKDSLRIRILGKSDVITLPFRKPLVAPI